MIITRTQSITRKVTKCRECPYFVPHPHEASCDKMVELGRKGYETIVPWNTISSECPFK